MLNYVINIIFLFLPPSPNRLRRLKSWLFKIAGNEVGDDVRLMRISSHGCSVSIGHRTFVGDCTKFHGSSGTHVKIGSDCDISSHVSFVTGTHVLNCSEFLKAAGKGYGKDITIGNGVWIGFGVTVIAGVNIGEGAMVGAGAVVTKNIPPYEVWGGVPARFIKKR